MNIPICKVPNIMENTDTQEDLIEAGAEQYARNRDWLERVLKLSGKERNGKRLHMVGRTRPKPAVGKPAVGKPSEAKMGEATRKACDKAVAAWMLPAAEPVAKPANKLVRKLSSNPTDRPKPNRPKPNHRGPR